MTVAIHAFRDDEAPARSLARALNAPLAVVETHRFPDGELLPRIPQPALTTIVYRSLNQPNEKLIELVLAAEAWRRRGARHLVLAAPYFCYMRQDAAFSTNEPISQRAIARMLDGVFDRIVTVDPHLHRISSMQELFVQTTCTSLKAAEALVPFLRAGALDKDLVIVGPDEESEPWVEQIARPLGLDFAVMKKIRRGDIDVELMAAGSLDIRNRPVLVVDDICSSGATLSAALRVLIAAGARSAKVYVTHALCPPTVITALRKAGAEDVISSDSCVHPTNVVSLAQLMAGALATELS
jgi:ribose-phosphate pyrophosphokinase